MTFPSPLVASIAYQNVFQEKSGRLRDFPTIQSTTQMQKSLISLLGQHHCVATDLPKPPGGKYCLPKCQAGIIRKVETPANHLGYHWDAMNCKNHQKCLQVHHCNDIIMTRKTSHSPLVASIAYQIVRQEKSRRLKTHTNTQSTIGTQKIAKITKNLTLSQGHNCYERIMILMTFPSPLVASIAYENFWQE